MLEAGMDNWTWPPTGPGPVKQSFFQQVDRHISGEKPSQEEIDAVLDRIEKVYPHSMPTESLSKPEIDIPKLRAAIEYQLDNKVVGTSSPGCPLRNTYPTNKAVLDDAREELIEVVLDRMIKLANTNLSQLTPAELVQGGFCDINRLFGKNEPHPERKRESGRWRLISSLSLVDQTIDRVLHAGQNNLEIALWAHIPSKPGIGFHTKESVAKTDDYLEKQIDNSDSDEFAQADIQGWDWSVQGYELDMEVEARVRLTRSRGTASERIMRSRNECLKRAVYAADSGELYTHTYEGVMKSGTYCTSSSNSRIRVMVAYLILAQWCFAMGDDSVEDPVPDAQAKYLKLGHKAREYSVKRKGEEYDFCSHIYNKGVTRPTDPTKTFFKLISSEISEERFYGFVTHLRNHETVDQYVATALADVKVSWTSEARENAITWQNDRAEDNPRRGSLP